MKAGHDEIFLHPGEFHFSSAPNRIGTLLGSCVAVTVWHPHHHIGGMCHILLPGRRRTAEAPLDGRFADEAIELFVLAIKTRHMTPASCQVKLFGGGSMFSCAPAGSMGIGIRNIDATRRAITRHGFRVMTEHVGGTSRRRLHLDLSSGHVWMAMPNWKQAI